MSFARKRILVDIKNIRKNEDLEKCGIHVKFNEDNIFNAQALIIGPKDTPYENGFYFFDINFPSDYPMEPPKVKFCTLDSKIRFNPNLYTCGKVCLSIINTWNGPGWTSCLTLNSVLLSIQSLLNDIPIRNEPGFETESKEGDTSIRYNRIIEYYNLKVAIVKMFEQTPSGFDYFKGIMAQYFMKNVDFFEDYISKNMEHNNKTYTSRIYSLNEKFNFQSLKIKLDKFKKEFSNISLDESVETDINDDQEEAGSKSLVIKRKKPDIKANEFDAGYKMISEHDGNEYIVKLIEPKKEKSQLSKSYKRWFLFKINN